MVTNKMMFWGVYMRTNKNIYGNVDVMKNVVTIALFLEIIL